MKKRQKMLMSYDASKIRRPFVYRPTAKHKLFLKLFRVVRMGGFSNKNLVHKILAELLKNDFILSLAV